MNEYRRCCSFLTILGPTEGRRRGKLKVSDETFGIHVMDIMNALGQMKLQEWGGS
ncbi:MAG: hypothetical protein P4L59_20290 [Desulfosporosinus sp.]|nr:hypothetical protein [Desulfosporosinus sp.]